MTYSGRLLNGTIVLEDGAGLPDSALVQIDFLPEELGIGYRSLRGTIHVDVDPFEPACDESDWDAIRDPRFRAESPAMLICWFHRE